MHKIVRSFLTNMPNSLAQLKAAGAAANWPEVGRLAHHIKPNLHTLGICDVSPALEVLVRLHSEEPASMPDTPAVLRQALAQLVAGVERALAVHRYRLAIDREPAAERVPRHVDQSILSSGEEAAGGG